MVATLLVPSILVRRITTIGFGTRNRLFHLVCSIPKGCNSVSSQLLRNKLTPFSNHNNRFSVATSLREAQKSEPQQNAADLNNLVPSQSESVVHHLELAKKKNIAIQREEKKELVAKNKKTIKQNLATIYRIIKLGKPDLKLFIYAIAFILIAVLYPTTAVKLVGASIDAYNSKFMDADGDLIIWGYKYSTVFAVMVPFMCFSAVCFWARIWVLKLLGERLVARLRLRVMKNLLRHDAAFYDSDKHKVGDLISRLSSDAYVVSKSITSNLPDGLKNLLFGIISAYMMYSINPILFGVMLLISPPITIGSVRYGEKIRELSTRLQNATAGLTKVSEETLNSIKLVKAFTGEPKELTKYAEQLRQVVKVAKKEAFAQSNYLVSIYTLYHTGYLSCIALGVYLILQGQMTTGDVVAFTMYLELFNLALYSLTTTYMELMKGSGAGVKLFDLIDHDNQVEPVKGEFVPPDLNNEIEFDNVVFSYPTRKHDLIFDGCTFKVPASSSTCFVAPSGCGKSTIAVLLLRSYNIQSGSIKIGGKDISEFQVRELRRSVIGIVQQEPILLSGSILENIVYGLTPSQIRMLTMDDIVEVCKQANCHDFIAAFPEGYDTIVGGRGASLSGGQKQRVAIARALIKKPKILILDEATSALDSKSEALINDTLRRLTAEGKMTIISIAHRLSTISKSENVIVFGKGGHVVESGKFQDLYSDASSELSKLLDESSAKKEYAKLSDEEIEEQDKLDYEAATIEAEQRETELEQVRALIDDLSPDLRKQLLEQISREADIEQGVPNTGYIKGQHKSL